MLDQLGRELIAGWKDDLSIRCLLELRASLTGSPVSMVELFQSTGCEGRELAGSGAPARAEELKTCAAGDRNFGRPVAALGCRFPVRHRVVA